MTCYTPPPDILMRRRCDDIIFTTGLEDAQTFALDGSVNKLILASVKTYGILTSEVKQSWLRSPLKAKQCITAMIKHLRRRILRQLPEHGLDHDPEAPVNITAPADVIGW